MAEHDTVQVAGAGPAGLAAAITLARAGRRVVVHEAHSTVGYRFQRDLQGIENWTGTKDALQSLRELGVATRFGTLPCLEGTAFDAWGRAYRVRSAAPIFYLVERGPRPGSFDHALLEQARELGVEVRFNSRLTRIDGMGVYATGPKIADAIAAGYHFDTDMHDGFWIVLDEALAPGGYAYLLVMAGRGTVKACLFSRFRDTAAYVADTVHAFRRLTGFTMRNERFHAGAGNLCIPACAQIDGHPIAGEQAGFQDFLGGFGMRIAIASGVLAARCLLAEESYDERWRRELGPDLRATLVCRALYGLVANRGYRFLLAHLARHDARDFLNMLYRPSLKKRLLLPFASVRYQSRRKSCERSAPRGPRRSAERIASPAQRHHR
jgi:flavin-dependent dehydrogenase